MSRTRKVTGMVAVLGAGPGDPGLLTVRAAELLAAADVVLADPGIAEEVLARAASAEVLPADDEAVKTAVTHAREGRLVVRLVAGDPYLLSDGADEVAALAKAKVTYEVVPGVSTITGVPSYAGIALGGKTGRTPVVMVHAGAEPDWRTLAGADATIVLADAGTVGKAAAKLVEHGRAGSTPVAVIRRGTTAQQSTTVTTLDEVDAIASDDTESSAVAVVGDVVKTRDKLAWFEQRPLFGWKVLVPRTRDQAGELSARLRALGGTPIEVPTIAVEPPRTPAPMDRAIRGLVSGRYAWVAFTSTNAVKAVREKLEEFGLDARGFAGVKVAAVGAATARALLDFGLRADLVSPEGQESSEGLLSVWPVHDEVLDPLDRVFLPRADIATETLVAGLKEHGWAVDDITAYRTVRAAPPPAPIREALKGGGFDAVLFTSSSTVRNLVGIAGKPHESTVLAAIGPHTADAIAEHGLRMDVQAKSASIEALVEALAEFAVERRAALADAPPAPPAKARSRKR